MLDADAVAQHLRGALDESLRAAEILGLDPEVIDLGGGLGVPYAPGEPELDLGPISEALKDQDKAVRVQAIKALEAFAPGSHDAAVKLIEVLTVKDQDNELRLAAVKALAKFGASAGKASASCRAVRNSATVWGARAMGRAAGAAAGGNS